MNVLTFTPPTAEERKQILSESNIYCDRRIQEKECKEITSICRTKRWYLEKEGRFPQRHTTGDRTCTWLLSDVLWWVRNPN